MAATSPRLEQPSRPDGAANNLLLADRPPIAALFLIEFDVKAGYTIAWKQAAPGLELGGAVEYKSLPSGLHAVAEDLIYFVHEDETGSGGHGGDLTAGPSEGGYAGLSAFVNLPTDEADARFARMIAVGVLVPRSYGRLGRAWRHAESLMAMARKLAADHNETPLLEAYWRDNSGPSLGLPFSDSPLSSPMATSFGRSGSGGFRNRHARNRSASDGTALMLPPGHRLSPHHPAWSLTALLDTFGPLVFPIYRAALLRKRILISTHAPVREVNNFVYNISVLANIPISVFDILEPAAMPQQRIRPLFTIGVNDIPFLVDDAAAVKRAALAAVQGDPVGPYGGPGWIACTTDSILAMKGELWDVLITMPPARATGVTAAAGVAEKMVWPTVEGANGVPIKATQRDLRRFRALATGLSRRPTTATGQDTTDAVGDEADAQLVDAAESIVEPVTWAALAYNGFMWWASAGEQHRAEDVEEAIQDASLLADLALQPNAPSPMHSHLHSHHQQQASVGAGRSSGAMHDSVSSLTARRAPPDAAGEDGVEAEHDEDEDEDEDRARIELAIIAYFHRLTTQMLSVMADIVESGSEDDEDDGRDAGSRYYYDDEDDEDDEEMNSSSSDGLLGGRRGGDGDGGGGGGVDGSGSGSRADIGLLGTRRSGLAPLPLRRRGGVQKRDRRQLQQQQHQHHPMRSRDHLHAADGTTSIRISSDARVRMGLDVWSPADVGFVRDVALQYFGRRGVQVEGKGIEVCGLKIC
ncbi:hypothetical protein CMQ_7504 [Grosmannia clavigera kw1407]|uniref:DUF4484 domain-containing protein n=1 Tax=Grosmannia clavigera (strain kw1407 / UAMH 11150) TaxID=655863 RepID=F0XQ84_GROCL|nr:uncharacterized protein CMQ_7504 [Grosmannia clavigera kw1407]EFX00502.1 hypothetical protein CMQ_7504 [Grosmannia clavigera kw1407]